jgi:hypothetical protein
MVIFVECDICGNLVSLQYSWQNFAQDKRV